MTHPLLPLELQIVACITLIAFFGWVLRLVRLDRLSLRDSFMWLMSTAVVMLLALFPQLLQAFARTVAIEVPSNALFALAIFYLTLNVLSLTIARSNASTGARRLAQECALLRTELDAIRLELREPARMPPASPG